MAGILSWLSGCKSWGTKNVCEKTTKGQHSWDTFCLNPGHEPWAWTLGMVEVPMDWGLPLLDSVFEFFNSISDFSIHIWPLEYFYLFIIFLCIWCMYLDMYDLIVSVNYWPCLAQYSEAISWSYFETQHRWKEILGESSSSVGLGASASHQWVCGLALLWFSCVFLFIYGVEIHQLFCH